MSFLTYGVISRWFLTHAHANTHNQNIETVCCEKISCLGWVVVLVQG